MKKIVMSVFHRFNQESIFEYTDDELAKIQEDAIQLVHDQINSDKYRSANFSLQKSPIIGKLKFALLSVQLSKLIWSCTRGNSFINEISTANMIGRKYDATLS